MKNEFKVIADLVEKNTRVLDVGCADGVLMEFLRDNKDIDILINSSSLKNIEIDNKKSDTIILYTPKGIVAPKTSGQKKYYKAVLKNDIVFAIGPAGSGKTYQAVACGVSALKNNEVEKIVITRPVVEAGENLGFLPGDLKDKVDPYLTPLYDALYKMVEKDKLKMYLDKKIIEIAPLAYMRGRTLHNSFMILDEAQNCTKMQMKMFCVSVAPSKFKPWPQFGCACAINLTPGRGQ